MTNNHNHLDALFGRAILTADKRDVDMLPSAWGEASGIFSNYGHGRVYHITNYNEMVQAIERTAIAYTEED